MRNEELLNKWKPILEHNALPGIQDSHKSAVTATLLENTETALKEGQSYSPAALLEAAPTNNTANVANYDPVLISLVRRAMPNLIAYDIAGVQPMTGPTGLIFAMRSNYKTTRGGVTTGDEAFYDEANPAFSGAGANAAAGVGMGTAAAEALGDGAGADFAEMSFKSTK